MSAIASSLPREATRPPALLAHSARQVGAVLSSVTKLAVPLAAVGLLNMAISVTDSIMIAALGRDLFATGALVSDSQSIVFYFIGSGLMILAPLAAAAAAARRDDGVGDLTRLFRAGFGLATLMAAIGFPLVLSIGWLLPAFGIHLPDPDAAKAYSSAIAFSCVASIYIQFARGILAPLGHGRAIVVASAVAVPINAALNTLLMFGMFGFPELGLAGTGYATAFSFAVVAAMLLTKAFRVAGVSPRAALRGIDGRRVIALALSAIVTGFSLLCETGLYLASTLAVGRLLPEAIADHVIAFRVTAICYCIYFGFGQAVSMVQARAGNSGSAVAAAFACALGIGLAGGIAAFITVGALADLSSHPGAAALPAKAGMTLTALALAVVGLGVLRGRGEFRLAAIISAVAYWGAGFGTMAAFAWIGVLDVSTIWLGLLAGTAATALGAWTAVLGPGVAALVRSRPAAEGEQATL